MGGIFQYQDRQIAYDLTEGDGPGVVFLGGFRSDKEGTKAQFLERWAKERGRAFLRFDYSGHGHSSGEFRELSIGDWAADAAAIIDGLTFGPQILVGSSMGGWIALLLARSMGAKVAGLATIAAAPDFTEDSLRAGFDEGQRAELASEGYVELSSEYDDQPYPITRKLIEDGRAHLVLRQSLKLPFPVHILHGTDDVDVDITFAYRLLEHAEGPDIRLIAVKNADHRFSDEACLDVIVDVIDEVTVRSG